MPEGMNISNTAVRSSYLTVISLLNFCRSTKVNCKPTNPAQGAKEEV
jgi:hypothetical protein